MRLCIHFDCGRQLGVHNFSTQPLHGLLTPRGANLNNGSSLLQCGEFFGSQCEVNKGVPGTVDGIRSLACVASCQSLRRDGNTQLTQRLLVTLKRSTTRLIFFWILTAHAVRDCLECERKR